MRSLPHYCLLVASNVYPAARVTRDFLKSIRAVPANPATHIANRVIKTVGLEPNGTILSFRNITMNKQIQNGTNFIPATPELRALNSSKYHSYFFLKEASGKVYQYSKH